MGQVVRWLVREFLEKEQCVPPPLRVGPSAYSQGSRALQPGAKAFAYLRVSTEDQKLYGFGLDAQRAQCRQLWESDGLVVPSDAILWDDYTGMTLQRPQFQQMMARIAQERPAALYIPSPSRLSRNAGDCFVALDQLTALGVRLRIADNPSLDPASDQSSRFTFQILACAHDFSKRVLVQTLRAGLESSVAQGFPLNHPPLGYVYVKLEPKGARWDQDPKTAPLVAEAFARFRADPNLTHLADWLTTTGVIPPRSHRRVRLDAPYHWHVPTVRFMLANTAYMGVWYWRKTERTPGFRALLKDQRSYTSRPVEEWIAVPIEPAIVETKLFAEVQALLADLGVHGSDRQKHDYLFRNGQLRCGVCPEPHPHMVGIRDITAKRASYECRRYEGTQVLRTHWTQEIWKLEKLAWEAIQTYLADTLPLHIAEYCATWQPATPAHRRTQLEAQRAQKQHAIDTWDLMHAEQGEAGGLSREEWARKRRIMQDALDALDAQLAQCAQAPPQVRPDPERILAEVQACLVEGQQAETTAKRRQVIEALNIEGVWTPERLTLHGNRVVDGVPVMLTLPPIPLPEKGRRDYSPEGTREAMLHRHPERLVQVEQFLADCCERKPGWSVTVADLYAAYTTWCAQHEEAPLPRIALGGILTTCGVGRHEQTAARGDLRTDLVLREQPALALPTPHPAAHADTKGAAGQRQHRERGRLADVAQLERFLAACCIREDGATVPSGALYAAYGAWCTATQQEPLSLIGFAKRLTLCGIGTKHGYTYGPNGKRGLDLRTGVRLRATTGDEPVPGLLLPQGQEGHSGDNRAVQLALLPDLDEQHRALRRRA